MSGFEGGKEAQLATSQSHQVKTKYIKLWAIGAVGSALERHSRGHPFEPDIAHHYK